MLSLTLRQRLVRYLEKHTTYIASGELQRLAQNAGYTPQNAGRRLRELVEDGIVEVEYRKPRNHAYYRIVKSKPSYKTEVVVVNGVPTAIQKIQ